MEGGTHRFGQIRLDVVPLLRDLVIRQNNLRLLHNPSPFLVEIPVILNLSKDDRLRHGSTSSP
jgi:hypothetical protein